MPRYEVQFHISDQGTVEVEAENTTAAEDYVRAQVEEWGDEFLSTYRTCSEFGVTATEVEDD